MRQWLDDNQKSIGGISIILIALFVAWMIFGRSEPTHTPEDEAWYYDAIEDRAFTAASRQIPPIESPWGNEAVRVFYFSCGGCGVSERFAGFYLKYDSETKARLEADPELKGQAFGESFEGRLYSSDATTWVAALNVGASGVTAKLGERCPGKLSTCR